MTTLRLRPRQGGFSRPFGCAVFVRGFLAGQGPHGSPKIDPSIGACQADICHHYKTALLRATAYDRAIRREERQARRQGRAIDPERIVQLAQLELERLPFKTSSCRYASFVRYFSSLIRLGWVELSGVEERSAFQGHYAQGQPRRCYRLTAAGRAAPDTDWANPLAALRRVKRR